MNTIEKSMKFEDIQENGREARGKVWILRVSDGLQSEICAFSSRKKAEEFIKTFQPGKAQGSDIVELDIDQTKIM